MRQWILLLLLLPLRFYFRGRRRRRLGGRFALSLPQLAAVATTTSFLILRLRLFLLSADLGGLESSTLSYGDTPSWPQYRVLTQKLGGISAASGRRRDVVCF
jgi:hypothetical protein